MFSYYTHQWSDNYNSGRVKASKNGKGSCT